MGEVCDSSSSSNVKDSTICWNTIPYSSSLFFLLSF